MPVVVVVLLLLLLCMQDTEHAGLRACVVS
jgi:hypothetical protein